MSPAAKQKAWAVALFALIGVFVAWKLWSTSEAKKRAASASEPSSTVAEAPFAPPPNAAPSLPPSNAIASAIAAAAGAGPAPSEDASAKKHVDIDTILPPSVWLDPPGTPSVAPTTLPTEFTVTDPDIPTDQMARSLSLYERRATSLESQLRAAENRGDTQEAERLKRDLESAKRRVAILRAELGK